ncbi:MAG: Bifunctional transcriptional activator/DNA repair enzyme Ada [Pseudomonas sp.]|nr:MAG: Bifunctional transcriptional activator/DNA repair enzyme Ada [Pseudomonas sp.]
MTRHPNEQDPRWPLIVNRDTSAAGTFVYGVRTTGVYCHPGSSARLPRPQNVEFFDTPQQAEAAGYRPNKRTSADQAQVAARHARQVEAACRHIEDAEAPPNLETLAALAGLSPFHFHRVFKNVTGLTPKAYADAHRSRKVRDRLKQQHSVTDALYDAGFNSNSRFYESADHMLGMTASDFKAGGANNDIHFAVGECTLGAILVAQSSRGVCAILLGENPDQLVRDLQDQFPRANLLGPTLISNG